MTISYLEISNRLKDTKRKKAKKRAENYSIKCDDYTVPPFSIRPPSKAKGAYGKWINQHRKIYTFVNSIHYLVDKYECTIIPISTNFRGNIIIFGSPKIISKYIKEMITIGLLSIESTAFQYGKSNRCRTYRYYKENEAKFIQFCQENHIEPLDNKVNTHANYTLSNISPSIDKSKVLFKTNRRLKKPNNLTCSKFEEQLNDCLRENYPPLRYYTPIADEINTHIAKDELKVKFGPSFKWINHKTIVNNIGIRASSSLNSTSKKDRAALLKKYGLDMEYDVTSSIPRIVRSLSDGKWFSEDTDLYAEIYKNCEQTDEFTDEMRKAIKRLFMHAFFDYSEKEMVKHIWINMDKNGIEKQEVAEQMIKLKRAIEKTCGKKVCGTEAFLAESCIYMRVFQRLLYEGRKGWLLYDCFYCSSINGETKEAFTAKVEQYIQESFDEYVSLSLENCI